MSKAIDGFCSIFFTETIISDSNAGVGRLIVGSTHVSSISVVATVYHYDAILAFNYLHQDGYKDRDLLMMIIHYNFAIAQSILFRFRFFPTLSNMADNLRRTLQEINLRVDDEPVSLPIEVCTEDVRANQFSLMDFPLIPRRQNLWYIVTTLPRNWGLNGIISGRIIERSRFQFVFPSEELMQSVLNRGPWAFYDRMIVLQRWNPDMDMLMLNYIPFWIQIRGIPLQFLTRNVISYIGGSWEKLSRWTSTLKWLPMWNLFGLKSTGMSTFYSNFTRISSSLMALTLIWKFDMNVCVASVKLVVC